MQNKEGGTICDLHSALCTLPPLFCLLPSVDMSDFSSNVEWYVHFYREYAIDWWRHLSPMGYGTILISVAVLGWIMMRGSPRR